MSTCQFPAHTRQMCRLDFCCHVGPYHVPDSASAASSPLGGLLHGSPTALASYQHFRHCLVEVAAPREPSA